MKKKAENQFCKQVVNHLVKRAKVGQRKGEHKQFDVKTVRQSDS